MDWFLLATLSPLLFALTNHIDKALLSRYFSEGGVGALLIFSAIASAMALPVIFLFDQDIFIAGLDKQAALAVAALFNLALLWLYLTALEEADPSIVVVFYQLVPAFGAILGFVFLGEVLTATQVAAMVVVMFGAAIASFDFLEFGGLRIRRKILVCMAGASFCWAASATVFKAVALEVDVLPSLFWEHVALTAFGIAIFVLSPRYRASFLAAFQGQSAPIISLNLLNEALYILGNVSAAFAYLMVPISFVLLAETSQPLMVFFVAVVLAIFAPAWSVERISKRDVAQKVLAILITGSGAYWLVSQT